METTSGEEVFAFIAAAAGTGTDDHHVEVVAQETEEPATKKKEVNLNHSTLNQMSPRRCWNFRNTAHRAYTAVADIVPTRHWFGHCVVKEPSHSSSDLHEILYVHHFKKFRVNVLIQSQVWKPFLPSGRTFTFIKQSGFTLRTALNTSFLLSLLKVVI